MRKHKGYTTTCERCGRRYCPDCDSSCPACCLHNDCVAAKERDEAQVKLSIYDARVIELRIQSGGAQACSACKAIHYLHPNAKQGGFSGPVHNKVGATCGRCGEMWPCDVTELREAYADRGRQLKEAQGKLDAATRAWGDRDMVDLARILKGE